MADMKTRTVSLNHPSVTREKLLGRTAIALDGRVGVVELDPLGGYTPVIGFKDKTWVPLGVRLIRLVVES